MFGKRKTKDIVKETSLSEKDGMFFGENCIVPSKIQSDEFCKGFDKAIEDLVSPIEGKSSITGLDRKRFQFKCRVQPIETQIPKEIYETRNPYIKEIFEDSQIEIIHFDAITNQTEDFDPYLSQKTKGEIKEDRCVIPRELIVEKFCKGYTEGFKKFMDTAKLDTSIYRANCKIDENEDGDKRIIHGMMRFID